MCRNGFDFGNDVADLCGGIIDLLHSGHYGIHTGTAVVRFIRIFLCLYIRVLCIFGTSLHSLCNVDNGRLQLFHCAGLVGCAFCQILCRFRHVLCACGYLIGGFSDGAQCGSHLISQALHSIHQLLEISRIHISNRRGHSIISACHLTQYNADIIDDQIQLIRHFLCFRNHICHFIIGRSRRERRRKISGSQPFQTISQLHQRPCDSGGNALSDFDGNDDRNCNCSGNHCDQNQRQRSE